MAEYQSPERGYSVRYPSDWKAQPNTIAVQNMAGDAFFTTATTTQVKPNLSVACETITDRHDITAVRRCEAGGTSSRCSGQRPEIEKTLTVDGREAFQVRYSIEKVQDP